MAISLGVCLSFLPAEKVSFCKSSPSTIIRPVSANVRVFRSVTISAAAKPATGTEKREPRVTLKYRVSPEMKAFLGGVSEISSAQAIIEIWAYIKQHNLQDSENNMVIICDEKLKEIFGGRDRVGYLEIAGLISTHLLAISE